MEALDALFRDHRLPVQVTMMPLTILSRKVFRLAWARMATCR